MNTEEQINENKKELKGVGGWLAFFVITLGILSPLRTLFGYYRDIILVEQAEGFIANDAWETCKIILIVLIVIAIILFITGGWRLWKNHVWGSVRYAIFVMWMACIGLFTVRVFHTSGH